MDLAIILIVYVLIIIFDFVPLLKKDNKKVILFYIVTSLFTLVILVLHTLGVVIPSPAKLIEAVIKSII